MNLSKIFNFCYLYFFLNYLKIRVKMNDINHYMKFRKIDKFTQMKIRRYIEYMHEEEKKGFLINCYLNFLFYLIKDHKGELIFSLLYL